MDKGDGKKYNIRNHHLHHHHGRPQQKPKQRPRRITYILLGMIVCSLLLQSLLFVGLNRQNSHVLDRRISSSTSNHSKKNFLERWFPERRRSITRSSQYYHFDIAVPAAQSDVRLVTLLTRSLGRAIQEFRRANNQDDVSFRLMVTRYHNETTSNEFQTFLQTEAALNTNVGDSVLLVPIQQPASSFSRAHAIYELQQKACRDDDHCLFAIVDVDMVIYPQFFQNSLKFLCGNTTTDDDDNHIIYFPIVWSEYEPKGVLVAEKIFGGQHLLEPFSEHRGRWREYGYGMFVMKGSDTQRLTMDFGKFQKWGGEDVDFSTRAQALNFTIVRQKEPGLVHKWHDKRCVPGLSVSTAFYDKCVNSVALLEGSDLIQFLKEKTPKFFDHLVQLPVPTAPQGKRTNEEANKWILVQKKYFDSGGTGSFANCTTAEKTATATKMLDRFTGSGVDMVSCRSFHYRAPLESFQEAGSLIVGVLSSASSTSRRQTIRSTWGSGGNKKGVFFIVSGPWKDVQDEFEQYRDMIWIDNPEEYSFLTYKTAMFLQIVHQVVRTLNIKQFTHVLKTDEDCYVALDRVKHHLEWWDEPNDYWGDCRPTPQKPFRDPENRWSVSVEEYPESRFPIYCQGSGFVLSRKFLDCASLAGHIENTRFLKHEDVFVGMIAERCGITATNVGKTVMRSYRTGLVGTLEERNRVNQGGERLPDGDWMPPAEMAGRIFQHRINSDKDMQDHHKTIIHQQQNGITEVNGMQVVEYYFTSDQKWHRLFVAEGPGEEDYVKIVTLDGYKRGYSVPYQPYLGEWRLVSNVSSNPMEALMGNQGGVTRELAPFERTSKPYITDILLDRFIVVPEYKLLFCYIEKAGCTMFNNLFRLLRLYHDDMNDRPSEAAFQANSTWYRNSPTHHSLERVDVERLLVNPEWTKAVFYRDPITRFVSAFRSKCKTSSDKDGHKICKRVFGNETMPFHDATKLLEEDSAKAFGDQHFAPMSHFCGGLGSTLQYYNFVQEIEPETSEQHVRSLFQMIGVDSNVTDTLVDSVVRHGGASDGKIGETVEKAHGIHLVDTSTRGSGSPKFLTKRTNDFSSYFSNLNELAQVQRAYAVDYETFELPRVHEQMLQFDEDFNPQAPKIVIGITTSRRSIVPRGSAIMSTWAKALPPNVVVRFYLGELDSGLPSTSAEEINSLASQAGIPDPGSIVVMQGIPDNQYPLVSKASAVLKHMDEFVKTHGDFDWILDADDDTYVNIHGLVNFLQGKVSADMQYLGRQGHGRPEIHDKIGRSGLVGPYCMGGPGIALSKPALDVLAGSIDACEEDARAKDLPLLDDVIIGMCMSKVLSIGCWDGNDYDPGIFIHLGIAREYPDGNTLLKAATLHDFKKPGEMMALHKRYMEISRANKK